MKYSVKSLALAATVALLAGTALAAEDKAPAAGGGSLIASTRIAVVNIQGVMRDATAAKSVREQLEAKQKTYQSELSKREESLQKEDQELAKLRTTLSKEAFEAKVKEFREKTTSTQKEVASKKATLDNAFENSLAQIQKITTDIISEISKEKGFVVALPSSQILYADSALDISSEVLSRLNQRLPRIDVKFETPSGASESPKEGKSSKKK